MLRVSMALAVSGLVAASFPAAAADAPKSPTFTRDVAPIFQQKCESCHRPDNMAPMSLTTYEEARPWAKSIAARVSARQMPPWHIDKTIGIQKFKNDRSLNDEQIETIVNWVNAGAPKGDPKDMPAPRVWKDESGWSMANKYGAPDLVVKSPEYTMPPVAQDAWWRPSVPTGLTEPRWVRAIEIRPVGKNARKITHHALARLQQPEDMDQTLFTNDPNVAADGLFMEWAGGKGMSMEAIYPDGKREMLSQVTDFNFNWHNMYIYDDDAAPLLPKGTILHFLAWYDNTKGNKANPDPDQWVGWGDRTVDEMGHAWINVTYYGDDDFKAEVAARAAKAVNTTAAADRQQ